ncbi:hypothetical protein L1987_38212 [Smallanthus sonchifolius]|uniref:Uncharacterized protein n=1 Tax=Smallanthus sonchifolius TaxID=185202 RepID=A0ACB9HIV9_9ASTR|nr:hypothetical protein L1987_38212 [Smallanthus sonchifolius]
MLPGKASIWSIPLPAWIPDLRHYAPGVQIILAGIKLEAAIKVVLQPQKQKKKKKHKSQRACTVTLAQDFRPD